MQNFMDLEESQMLDSSLDLDGKLLNENFGADVSNDNININDLTTPLND